MKSLFVCPAFRWSATYSSLGQVLQRDRASSTTKQCDQQCCLDSTMKYCVEYDLLMQCMIRVNALLLGSLPVDALHATMNSPRMPASMLIHYASGRHTAVVAMLFADRSPPSPPELLCSRVFAILEILFVVFVYFCKKNGCRKYAKMRIILPRKVNEDAKGKCLSECVWMKWKMKHVCF